MKYNKISNLAMQYIEPNFTEAFVIMIVICIFAQLIIFGIMVILNTLYLVM